MFHIKSDRLTLLIYTSNLFTLKSNCLRVLENMHFFIIRLISLMSYYMKKVIYLSFFILISSCVQTIDSALPTAVSLVSGSEEIIISSPLGFCVDQKLANKSSSSITLFIIDCIKINSPTGVKVKRRPLSAILTATVIDNKSFSLTSVTELKKLLTTKPGINYLSKSNTTATIKVHRVEIIENVLLFLIEQRLPNIGVKQSNHFWRSFFFTKGKLVAMTANNFSDDKDSQLKLRQKILEFSEKTMLANSR